MSIVVEFQPERQEIEMKIISKDTSKVIGRVVAGQSLTFDQAMELAGFEWKTYPEVECDGWYDDSDVLWDETVAEIEYD